MVSTLVSVSVSLSVSWRTEVRASIAACHATAEPKEREKDLLKIKQHGEEVFKIQQDTERRYSKSSKTEI